VPENVDGAMSFKCAPLLSFTYTQLYINPEPHPDSRQ